MFLEEEKWQEMKKLAGTTLGILLVAALVSVIFLSPAFLWQFFDIVQILRYILFMEINYPVMVHKFFEFFSVAIDLNFIPDFIGNTN